MPAGASPALPTTDLERLTWRLDGWLPPATAWPSRLHGAMRHAMDGGKRLRALLVWAGAEAVGLPAASESIDRAAAAVECIHAYSLVHDDLPAMDDDDLRRGRPTVHRAFDEATAILAGDALQTLAFELLASDPGAPPAVALARVRRLARASGAAGMCGGQQADIDAERRPLAVTDPLDARLAGLARIHRHKTGALIAAAVMMGTAGREAELGPDRPARLERFAASLGLAFQIQDDVLDATADTATLGKTAGKDQAQGKLTYVGLLGIDAARARAVAAFREAEDAIAGLGAEARGLRRLAARIAGRAS